MPDSALYYPYIDVPEKESLNAVLLYWDRLGAIVPRPISPNSFTRELVETGLVAPIAPSDFLGMSATDFAHGFNDLLDALPPSTQPSAPIFIHVDKGLPEIWEMLRARGLATRSPAESRAWRGRQGWVCVEGRAGALYMAYLASWLGSLPQVDMEPITDQRRMFSAMGGMARDYEDTTRFDRTRGALLEEILPSPAQLIRPQELVAFKERHESLLRGLRRQVEQIVLKCAQEPDPYLYARLVRAGQDELVDGVEEVRRRLAERRWPTATGTFCAVLSGLPGVAGGVAAGKPAVGAAAGVVPLVIDFVRTRLSDPSAAAPPAATYAVLAQEEFG
jgi:hypothetical protein